VESFSMTRRRYYRVVKMLQSIQVQPCSYAVRSSIARPADAGDNGADGTG